MVMFAIRGRVADYIRLGGRGGCLLHVSNEKKDKQKAGVAGIEIW
jgi:hypothetical protein